jgi:transcriptional regulator with XRE-family HTH domain
MSVEIVTLRYPSLALPSGDDRDYALKYVGRNIRRERTSRLLSQEKLATTAAIRVGIVEKIEAGQLNVRPETLDRIRRAIGCSLSKLAGCYL